MVFAAIQIRTKSDPTMYQ